MRQAILDIDPSEVVELEIRRHPIGLVGIYSTGLLLIIAFLGLAVFLGATDLFGNNLPLGFAYVFIGALSFLIMLATYISARVYGLNELIITNENLIQVIQTSLFNRKISQLSLEKVQDVSSTQSGVIQSVFNYGTIFIETAGEAANFGFRYARDPNISAKHINEAHERFIKKFGIDVV